MSYPSPPSYDVASTQPSAPSSPAHQINPNFVPQSDSDRMNAFAKTLARLEINNYFAAKLRQLEGFEIVMVLDDSGSMDQKLMPPVNQPFAITQTRWQELKETVKTIAEIAMILDKDGIDLYFLNRGVVRNVNRLEAIEQAFVGNPSGYTPIQSCVRHVLADKMHVLAEKRLLIIIATDGEPTDMNGCDDKAGLKRFLQRERPPKVHVEFLVCTDDENSVSYLQEWDDELEFCDVCDDYFSEREEILKCQGPNFPFSRGDYVVKALLGSIDRDLDELDEKPRGGINLSRAASQRNRRKSSWGCVIS